MDYDLSLLRDGCRDLGIEINEKQEEQFLKYYELLIEKNKVMNLTAITEFHEVVVKHFLDSVSISKAVSMKEISSLIDVGTGAGFPGIPIKIMFPWIDICLMDSLNKRISFLNEVIDQLQLENICSVHSRAEDLARDPKYRENFDICVSRAVANLSVLAEYCVPFVKKNGLFIAYKSGNIEEEISSAEKAIQTLGAKTEQVYYFSLPGSEIERSFVKIQKERPTPKKFPRKAGTPSKMPL